MIVKLGRKLLIRFLIQLIVFFSLVFLTWYLLISQGGIEALESSLGITFPLLSVIPGMIGILLIEYFFPLTCTICNVGNLSDVWTTDLAVLHKCNHCKANYRNFTYDGI